jgi:hypothetical protein
VVPPCVILHHPLTPPVSYYFSVILLDWWWPARLEHPLCQFKLDSRGRLSIGDGGEVEESGVTDDGCVGVAVLVGEPLAVGGVEVSFVWRRWNGSSAHYLVMSAWPVPVFDGVGQ